MTNPVVVAACTLSDKVDDVKRMEEAGAAAVVVEAAGEGGGTATEAAAYGVLGALAIAWWSGGLDWQSFRASLMGATRLSCMIMFILGGASFLSSCMAFTGIPRELAAWVASLNASPLVLIAVLAVIYLLLGMAIDGISMIVLTTSIVLPMVEAAGFDLIWFGIFVTVMATIGLISPPVGLTVFVIQSQNPDIPAARIYLGTLPFLLADFVLVVLLIVFPSLALWLPGALKV